MQSNLIASIFNYFLFLLYTMPRIVKRKIYRKKRKPAPKYRNRIARIARPLNVKPRAAKQKVTYYNSFLCRPALDASGGSGLKQRNFSFTMNLNSLWPFDNGYNDNATNTGKVFEPNEAINGYSLPVTSSMTSLPNVRDGSNLFNQFSKCAVVGAKITLVATPIQNSTDVQLGYLYAVKHSQPSSGLGTASTVVDVQKMPFRQMAKLKGAYQNPTAPAGIGAKLVIKHSPRKFNQIKDLRDNQQLFNSTGSDSAAHKPNEADYLTVGCVGALNGLDTKCTDFCLQVRCEYVLLWTEPLENLSEGTGNYSFPWAATLASAGITAAGMYM